MFFGDLYQKNMHFKHDMLFFQNKKVFLGKKLDEKSSRFYGQKKQNKSFCSKIVNVNDSIEKELAAQLSGCSEVKVQ